MVKRLPFPMLFLIFAVLASNCWAQGETSPVKIKINRIVFNPGNRYAVYIPSLEFHVLYQQNSRSLRSSVSADYDFQRQDMGFGMSHAFFRYVVNPGITVEDNLYFRKVFNDSTGVWNRRQTVTPFLVHQFSKNSVIGMEFMFERESSPKIKEGSSIIRYQDRTMRVYYLFQTRQDDSSDYRIYYISMSRSFKILNGSFNYHLLELMGQYSTDMNPYVRYKNIFSYRGNLTPQDSPLFFLGGHSSLIGFENDEFWGRQVAYTQNLLEMKPFPRYRFSFLGAEFRRLAVLFELDLGRVDGAPPITKFAPQNSEIKAGLGVGVGFNTDLPYMPKTDVHFMFASPSSDPSNLKFYAGFGGWIN